MKTAIITTAILLAGCASGECPTAEVAPVTPVAVVTPEPEPTPPVCTETTFTNCTPPPGMEICDVTTFIPCQYPTWIPVNPRQ